MLLILVFLFVTEAFSIQLSCWLFWRFLSREQHCSLSQYWRSLHTHVVVPCALCVLYALAHVLDLYNIEFEKGAEGMDERGCTKSFLPKCRKYITIHLHC